MWTPLDITAVPTWQDLILAKRAISEVRKDLADALVCLAKTKRRIAHLESDLLERRMWVAPVRRLKPEILSYIFDLCGQVEWRTPLRIAAVSRGWRNVVMDTPGAWEYLDLEVCADEQTRQLFFQRSGQRLLHAALPPSKSLALLPSPERLQCLSFNTIPRGIMNLQFPHLLRLSMIDTGNWVTPSFFNTVRFPSLIYIYCGGILHAEDERRYPGGTTTVVSKTFSPVQIMALLITTLNTAWIDLLLGCQGTLRSLRLEQDYQYTPPSWSQHEILLPSLVSLEIHRPRAPPGFETKNTWPLHLKTPLLNTYIEGGGGSNVTPPSNGNNFYSDVKSVTHMHLERTPPLSYCSKVRHLRLESRVEEHYSPLYSVMTQLSLNKAACPNLEVIETCLRSVGISEKELQSRLIDMNMGRIDEISVVQTMEERSGFPGVIMKSCGNGMPCNLVIRSRDPPPSERSPSPPPYAISIADSDGKRLSYASSRPSSFLGWEPSRERRSRPTSYIY